MTVSEAQGRINSQEFAEWMAFYDIEPFGDKRADMQAAYIASAIFDAMAPKKSGSRWDWLELLRSWEIKEPKVQTAEEQLAKVMELHKHFGGD